MSFSSSPRSLRTLMAAIALILALAGSGTVLVAAQESAIPVGAPVDVHSGNCADPVAEPAYDGGAIEQTTTDDVWNEETLQAGIFEDDQLQASGIDFNSDGSLQPEEVITPNGVSTDMGRAQMELESAVDTAEPYVVAVHASPDAYDTLLACGSIEGAQEVDGQTVVYLQATENSNLFGFSVLTDDNQTLTTYLFQPNQAPLGTPIPAEETADLAGHPVDIHSGTCNDFVSEPVYDLGEYLQTNEYAPGEQEPGDMEGELPPEAQELGPVYKVQTEEVDFGEEGDLIAGGPYVVAVHQSAEEYSTIVSCGQLLETMDEENFVIFLHPVAGSNLVGYVELDTADSTAEGYLWQVQEYSAPAPPATPTPGATPAPAPTPTPEPTPTQVATAVITETEVVPAATATAMAEGEMPASPGAMEPVPVEIGGDAPVAVTASPNQTLALTNSAENERTFVVPDLQLEATVGGGGGQSELLVPENAEPGTYTYQVMEGDTVVFEGEFTVQ